MAKPTVVIVCGGSRTPGLRTEECDSPLHDWPTPAGYVDAFEVAGHRLNHGWKNVRCKKCNTYGWVPGLHSCTNCAVPT